MDSNVEEAQKSTQNPVVAPVSSPNKEAGPLTAVEQGGIRPSNPAPQISQELSNVVQTTGIINPTGFETVPPVAAANGSMVIDLQTARELAQKGDQKLGKTNIAKIEVFQADREEEMKKTA